MKKIPVGRLFEAQPHEWVLTTYGPGVIGQREMTLWRLVPDCAIEDGRAYEEWKVGLFQ